MNLLFFTVALLLFIITTIYKKRKNNFLLRNKEKEVLIKISPNRNSLYDTSVAENFFSVIHDLNYKSNFWDRICNKNNFVVAVEIVNIKGEFNFIIRTSEKYVKFITSQIYAHYPDVEINISEDYCRLKNHNYYESTLVTANSSIWPIKRYSQFDNSSDESYDSLSGVILAILQENQNDLSGISMRIEPIESKYFNNIAEETLEIIQKFSFNFFSRKKFKNCMLEQDDIKKIYNIPRKMIYKIFRFLSFKSLEDSKEEVNTQKNHDNESKISSAYNKIGRVSFKVEIKSFLITNKPLNVKNKLKLINSSFKQFDIPHLNYFTAINYKKINNFKKLPLKIRGNLKTNMVFNSEELATIFHIPDKSVKVPSINWVDYKKISAPLNIPIESEEELTTLGSTNFRNESKVFGIRSDDRRRHIYIAGKTGMGKSTLLENMIFSDIHNGRGVGVIDPHGDLADDVLKFIPKNRTNDVIIFNPHDSDFPISFNILECRKKEDRFLVASGVLSVFKKMFADSWGPRLEHILRNVLLTLVEVEGQSIMGVLRILSDKKYRDEMIQKVKDPIVLSFWKEEFATWQPRQVAEAVSPIQNKVGQFLSSSLVRNILGQNKSSFNLRFAMDTGKIVIINLSKGLIGEDVSKLIGSLMVTKFQLDVMSRADIPSSQRKDFYLYVDEFQNFATESFATILSEARKYKLNLTVANQYLSQMDEDVMNAIFGNVGTLMSFQVGFDDAKVLADQFGGEDYITPSDIGSLAKYNIYTRLMIDGMPSNVFSSRTLMPPDFKIDKEQMEKIIKISRERYAKKREIVEDKIKKWSSKQNNTPVVKNIKKKSVDLSNVKNKDSKKTVVKKPSNQSEKSNKLNKKSSNKVVVKK